MRYAVVIEKAGSNYSAYVPDLPGCLATGATVAEVAAELPKAIRFHIEGLRKDGLPVPEPMSLAEYVERDGHEPLSKERPRRRRRGEAYEP